MKCCERDAVVTWTLMMPFANAVRSNTGEYTRVSHVPTNVRSGKGQSWDQWY